MTYREIIYACLDSIKAISDDSYITEEHVLFFLSKIRGLVLKQVYSNIKKEIPESNYQTIQLGLVKTSSISIGCKGNTYLKSIEKVPTVIPIGTTSIYPMDYFHSAHITFINRDRMKFVGHNKWLKNIIYVTIGPDQYLYLTSSNPQFQYLQRVSMTGIFEDPVEVAKLGCGDKCDILDSQFPLEESLVSQVIELTVKYLLGIVYRPKDNNNNAQDDMSDIMTFIRRNMKSEFQKNLEE